MFLAPTEFAGEHHPWWLNGEYWSSAKSIPGPRKCLLEPEWSPCSLIQCIRITMIRRIPEITHATWQVSIPGPWRGVRVNPFLSHFTTYTTLSTRSAVTEQQDYSSKPIQITTGSLSNTLTATAQSPSLSHAFLQRPILNLPHSSSAFPHRWSSSRARSQAHTIGTNATLGNTGSRTPHKQHSS